MKGAPEYVLPMCTYQLNREGELDILSHEENDRILNQEIIENQAKLGLRTLAYAYKDIDVDRWEQIKEENNNFESEKDRESLEFDLVFAAAFGLNDELRAGVAEAIKKL